MKCTIPEISWHNREPVLSVDIQPLCNDFYRLATGGADSHVLIWQLYIQENGGLKVEALSDLTRHQRAVNCVKWSSTGVYLVSSDDDANIIIWKLKTDNIPLLEGDNTDKETWIVHKVMRGHKEDVYDLCWSPNDLKILSGSVDNTAILWDVEKGKLEQILSDHKGFVQGVSWDPKGQYFATISTDRTCRIFNSNGKQVLSRIQKGKLPVPESHFLHDKEVKYFHDDTFKSFFRRLHFSPDGSLLAVPSGSIEDDESNTLNATYVFAVDLWTQPVAVFPSGKQSSTVVRFCPILFELHQDGPESIISLPYRMILAIGTDHDMILYDTQQLAPFAYFKYIHYTRLTDITWSRDGRMLIASSTDGFCALVTFEPNELGVEYVKPESEPEENVLEISGCERINYDDTKEDQNETEKKASFLEKWSLSTPNKNGTEAIKVEDRSKEIKRIVPKRITPFKIKLNNAEDSKATETHTATTEDKSKETILEKVNVETPKENKKKKKQPAKGKQNQANTFTSPLLKFLKSPPPQRKSVTKKDTDSDPVVIVLDEIEARDAWKCDKDEKMVQESPNVIDISGNSEDFVLEIDETVSSAAKLQQNLNNETKKTEAMEVESPKPVTKRRIPLITLSSPKTVKK